MNHADYYKLENGLEAIDIIDRLGLTKGFCIGNAIKYIVRNGRKDGECTQSDINKAIWYLEYFNAHLNRRIN